MTGASGWRFWLRCAALLLLTTGLALPPVRTNRTVFNVLTVLDITGSMNVRDQSLDGASASRIAMEKRAVRRLLGDLPCGSRLGVAVFVEKQPFLLFEPVEVCENFAALDQEVGAVDWRMGWDSESHIADALTASMRMAAAMGADLIFMTDGQETPPVWWNAMPDFSRVRGSVRGLIEGVGGRTLVAIPKYNADGREIGVFKPGDVPTERDGMFRGREYMSAVDEPHLRGLAALSALAYVHLEGADGLYAQLAKVGAPRPHSGTLDLAPAFAAAALLLLALASLPLSVRSSSGLAEQDGV